MKKRVHVIGIGCIGPGAHSPVELWENVCSGRRSFRMVLPERLPEGYVSADALKKDTTYLRYFAPLSDWDFDPVKYRIPPLVAEKYDIAHWLALDAASQALVNAGVDLNEKIRNRTEVIMGNSLTGEFSRSFFLRYRWPYVKKSLERTIAETGMLPDDDRWREFTEIFERLYKSPFPAITEDSLAGGLANVISGRIAHYFDFGGGAYSVDGACSSSLIAIARAAGDIRSGRCDVAVTGGVDVSLGPFEMIGFSKTAAFSHDDIRPYDARAAGMLPGEGSAVLVLASEKILRETGASSYGAIRGWGISSDGGGQGITAPDINGQMRAIRAAYDTAGYSVSSVRYFEGHGTGTTVGDRVELSALRSLLTDSSDGTPSFIGSIKANIGHTKAAAGAFGALKALLAMKNGIIPVTTNCEIPNPVLGSPPDVLCPVFETADWDPKEKVRRTGVSAMGFGGSNAHVTMERTACNSDVHFIRYTGYYPHTDCIFPLSAASPEELKDRLEYFDRLLSRVSFAELADLSAELIDRDEKAMFRVAFVGRYPDKIRTLVRRIVHGIRSGETPESLNASVHGVFFGSAAASPRILMLFPGQGSQFLSMGRFFYRYDSIFRKRIHSFSGLSGQDDILRDSIVADTALITEASRVKMEHRLMDTVSAQPAIVGTSLAMLDILRMCGISPDVCIGHSLGEITAYAAAGAFSPEDAVRTASFRGKAMVEVSGDETGGMAAVHAEKSFVQNIVDSVDGVTIANYNAPEQYVLSGSEAGIQQIATMCEQREVGCTVLPVSHAFHSSFVAGAADIFRKKLAEVPLGESMGTEVFSGIDGKCISGVNNLKDRLADHIAAPVRFMDAVRSAAVKRDDLIIECGPGNVLSRLVSRITDRPEHTIFSTLSRDVNGPADFLRVLAAAYTAGVDTDMEYVRRIMQWRPFPYESYNPGFIVNPCEKPQFSVVEKSGAEQPAAPASLYERAVSWIAARTGFPEETIRPEMKLRDDFGLDSIKTGELALDLARTVNPDLSIGDPTVFSNASVQEIVASIRTAHEGDHGQEALGREKKAMVAPDSAVGSWHHMFDVRHRRLDISSSEAVIPDGPVLVLAENDDTLSGTLASLIRKEFESVTVMSVNTFIRGSAEPEKYSICVCIPDFTLPGRKFSPGDGNPLYYFRILRKFIGSRDVHGDRFIFSVLRFYRSGSGVSGQWNDAAAGLLKTVHLEYRHSVMKWLTMPDSASPRDVLRVLRSEISSGDMRISLFYNEQLERFFFSASHPVSLSPGGPKLADGAVVLVTGGARGITYDHVKVLTSEFGVSVALVGSSPLIKNDGDEKYDNIIALKRVGITVKYYQCDVSVRDSVGKLVVRVNQDMGRIRGILHGAGVSSYERFRDLDDQTFMRAVDVKVNGCLNIINALGQNGIEQLEMFHVISSVLARTGMRNQASYVFSNSWLDETIQLLRNQHPSIHAVSVGYTAWKDTGMASGEKSNVLEYLSSIGVASLSPETAMEKYRTVLKSDDSAAVLTVTGRLTPDLENNLFLPPLFEPMRFIETVLRHIPGTELVAECTVSTETDPVLEHHVYRGTCVFPLVMYLEMAAQAVTVLTDERVSVFSDISVRTPLIIPPKENVCLRVYAVNDSADRIIRVAIRSERDGFSQDLMTVELSTEPLTAVERHVPEFSDNEKFSTAPEDFYPDPLFQGELLRSISAVHAVSSPERADVSISVPEDSGYFNEDLPDLLVAGSPAARDSYLQAALIARGELLLPDFIESVRVHRPVFTEEQLCCRVAGDRITVTDVNGAVVEEIIGMRAHSPDDGGVQLPPLSRFETLFRAEIEATSEIGVSISESGKDTEELLSPLVSNYFSVRGERDSFTIIRDETGALIVESEAGSVPHVSAAHSGAVFAGIVCRQDACGVDIEMLSTLPPVESLQRMTGLVGSDFSAPDLSERDRYLFAWLFLESWKKIYGTIPETAPVFLEQTPNFRVFSKKRNEIENVFCAGLFSMPDNDRCAVGILFIK